MERARCHVLISGRVQGVCFRAFTQREAMVRGLTGWVQNLGDGRVEAVFEGDKKTVEDVCRWCHEGPSAAKVTSVDVRWEPYTGEFQSFGIL